MPPPFASRQLYFFCLPDAAFHERLAAADASVAMLVDASAPMMDGPGCSHHKLDRANFTDIAWMDPSAWVHEGMSWLARARFAYRPGCDVIGQASF